MKKLVGLLFIAALISETISFINRPVRLGPGEKVHQPPVQTDCAPDVPSTTLKGMIITPLAQYDITAKIILKERYFLDSFAKICPIDLVLGWGPMSDESIIDQLRISQQARWYIYTSKTEPPPVPLGVIAEHSANTHIVPATPEIKRAVLRARQGEMIHISGNLIQVESKNRIWKSSLSRRDKGAGSCEIVLVDHFEIVTP